MSLSPASGLYRKYKPGSLDESWMDEISDQGWYGYSVESFSMVTVAQLVEPRIVIPVVVGSSPISHPNLASSLLLYEGR